MNQAFDPRAVAARICLRRRRARKDFNTYCMERGFWPGRAHQIVNSKLEDVARGRTKRLIVIAYPGFAKSTYISQLFPSWLMTQPHWGGAERNWDILATSHNSDLAEDFSYKVRAHVKDDNIGILEYELETDAVDEWRTNTGHAYRAYGIMAGITGRRFDVGIGDDWVKSSSDADSATQMRKLWRAYLGDFHSRSKPDGAIVIVMTHWTELDPIGMTLPKDWDGESGTVIARDGVPWEVVHISALCDDEDKDILGRKLGEAAWPEWQSQKSLEQIRRTLTSGGESRTWTACYQGKPSPEEGTYFKKEWFQYFDKLPPGCRFIVSSDFAVSENSKADFIVHGLWAVDSMSRLYLLDIWRRRAQIDNDGIDAALDMVTRGMGMGELATWLNEKGVILKALGGAIRTAMQQRNIYIQQDDYARTADKRAMASSIKGRYAKGMVFHQRNAPWVAAYEAELLKFLGGGGNDDQVDMAALVGMHLDKVIAPVDEVVDMIPARPERMDWS